MSTINRYDQLFGNFFNNERITNARLLNFSEDAQGRMAADNADNRFNPVLADLLTSTNQMRSEVSDVDVALTLQKGATLDTDKILSGFKFTMSSSEGAIAYSLGGRDTAAYLEFYPQGLTEYALAIKNSMPMLTDRVFAASNNHQAKLPPALFNDLTVFKAAWANARTNQQLKKGTVEDNREERNANRVALEEALLKAIHFVAGFYPGNTDRGRQYFDFNLLFSTPKYQHEMFTGTIAVGQTSLVINRQLSALTAVTIRNTDANASLAVWMGPSANDAMPDTAITINAGNSRELNRADLGASSINTFLLIKNLHPVNEGRYEAEIKGPQPKEPVDEVE